MQRKKPIVLLISTSIIIAYLIFKIASIYYLNQSYTESYIAKQKGELITYAKVFDSLLKAQYEAETTDILDDLIDHKTLIYYEISKNNSVIKKRFLSEENIFFDEEANKFNILREYNDKILFTLAPSPYILTIGMRNSAHEYALQALAELKNYILVTSLVVFFLILFTIRHYFKDLNAILDLFRKKKGGEFSKLKSNSLEAEIFIKGITSYETWVKHLRDQNQTLSNQVLPALRSEILSGKLPPYQFGCTMVRTDINNFSHIFSHYPVEEFMLIINGFFEEATGIISKYKGYVHEFVGDEIIYYFKDDDHTNSTAIAISAINEINDYASQICIQTKNKQGYPFVVKSSVSYGDLRFGIQVNNFSLAGGVLIESVRILSHIHEKDENTIYFTEELSPKISPVFEIKQEQSVELKGIPGKKILYSVVRKKSISQILESISAQQDNESQISLLYYYRQTREQILILDYLSNNVDKLSKNNFLSIINILKVFTPIKTPENLKHSFNNLLVTVREKYLVNREQIYSQYLSSLSFGTIKLISKDSFDKTLESTLKSLVKLNEKRIQANVLDVFSFFDPGNDDVIFQELLASADNRILANALIKEGIKELNRRLIRSLRKMLEASDPLYTASGLYALGEIAIYHRRNNPVYYDTHLAFQKLIRLTDYYLDNSNEMIRRQAKAAKEKTISNLY